MKINKDKIKASKQANQFLRDLAQPLTDVGIKGVRFARVFDDGSYITSCTEDLLPEYLASNKHHIAAHVPENLVKSRFWYFVPNEGRYLAVLEDYKKLFNISSIFNCIDRQPGYYDVFGFYSKEKLERATNVFLNQIGAMEKFTLVFKSQSDPVMNDLLEQKNRLLPEMTANWNGLSLSEDTDSSRIKDLLDRILLETAVVLKSLKDASFTNREYETLRFLLLGHSTKEIAEALQISPRTVEDYVDNIKNKLGCSTKSEIRSYFLPFSK